VVVAAYHPLVRQLGTAHRGDHVVDRLHAPFGANGKVDGPRPRPGVVGDGQRATPPFRRHGPVQRRQEMLRVGVGDRQHRDFQDGDGLRPRQPAGVRRGAHAGGQRVARIERHVGHGAALYALGRPGGSVRIGSFHAVAVLGRVGVDDAADGPMVLRQLRLQPAPALAIARDHDAAAHVDAHAVERLVVVRHAVVHIDQRGGHIAVPLVGDVGGQRPGGPRGGGVASNRAFLERGPERRWVGRFQHLGDRRGIQHGERLDMRVPAPVAEQLQLVLGVGLVVRRADLVRLGRHRPHPAAQVVRMDGGIQHRPHIGAPRDAGQKAKGQDMRAHGRSSSPGQPPSSLAAVALPTRTVPFRCRGLPVVVKTAGASVRDRMTICPGPRAVTELAGVS
jgi:hypothetical protein